VPLRRVSRRASPFPPSPYRARLVGYLPLSAAAISPACVAQLRELARQPAQPPPEASAFPPAEPVSNPVLRSFAVSSAFAPGCELHRGPQQVREQRLISAFLVRRQAAAVLRRKHRRGRTFALPRIFSTHLNIGGRACRQTPLPSLRRIGCHEIARRICRNASVFFFPFSRNTSCDR